MTTLDRQSPSRRALLTALKANGPQTAPELADTLSVGIESARQHLKLLEADGMVAVDRDEVGTRGGRPAHRYRLTSEGENVFPKEYDALAVTLIDAVGTRLGPEALRAILGAVVDAKVAAWSPRLAGLTTDAERLEALRAIYVAGDPWVEVLHDEQGPMLVERNCPFLDVAMRRPALCSTTVFTLSRLLGRRVVRTTTFQGGEGRCTFRISDEPVAPDAPLRLEGE